MIWAGRDAPKTEFQLAHYIEVRGRLEWRDGTPVIVVSWNNTSANPHAELAWWMEVKHVHDRVYCKEFSIEMSSTAEGAASQQL